MGKKNTHSTINEPATLDKFTKTKAKLANSKGRGKEIVKFFGKINQNKLMGPAFSKITRKFVGANLHSLKVEVNDYCNQSCKTCYMPKEKTDLPMEIVASIADEIKGYNINFEIIGGEPLLRDDLEEIVQLAKHAAGSPRVSVYTNGTLVTSERSTALKNSGLDVAIVTLHSHKEEVHDGIAGNSGSFKKAVAGIRMLKEAGIKVYVATVVHRENVGHIRETCRFVESSLGASSILTKYIPDGPGSPFTLGIKEWRGVRNWLIHQQKVDHMKEVENFFSLTGSCPSGNYIMAVKCDGTVQPCPFATGFALGKLPDSTLWDIYSNRFEVEKFRELKSIPNVCEECALKHLCGGGCRSASFGVYDGLCGKDPMCGGPFKECPKDEEIMDVLPIHF